MSTKESQPILPQQISQAPPDLLISCMDSGLQWAHRFFIGFKSGLWAGQSRMFTLLIWRYSCSAPVIRYDLGRYHAGRQNVHPTQVLLQTAWGCLSKSSCSLLFSWFLWRWQDSHLQTHWNIPTALYSHLHISLWERCSLGWVPLPSFSKHRQHLCGQRTLVLSHLTEGHISSMYNCDHGPQNQS